MEMTLRDILRTALRPNAKRGATDEASEVEMQRAQNGACRSLARFMHRQLKFRA